LSPSKHEAINPVPTGSASTTAKEQDNVITGASQGIGAGLVNTFAERGYNVVATSRRVSQSSEIPASEKVARVDGDIADAVTARKVVDTALSRFGRIDALVNNAGIFFAKPFIDYTLEDYRTLAGMPVSVAMITKGGIEAASKNIAMEYAQAGIRVNTVAPGVVDTPLHKDNPKDFLRTLSPMQSISSAQEIVDAVVFLTEAPHITGEVLHADGGAHLGRW
jgi:NAD(P)-dependent dehydrogenase (short-subunit alcohol dehydrogenase family)